MRCLLLTFVLLGCGASPSPLSQTFATGTLSAQLRPRGGEAGLKVLRSGGRTFTLLVKRDASGAISKRLAVSGPAGELWQRAEGTDERLTDFTVHPSGEVSLGVERRSATERAYELLRLDASGGELRRQVLERPSTLPASDLPAPLSNADFLLKGVPDGSVVTGWLPWLRLEARGEGLALGVLSRLRSEGVVSALLVMDWAEGQYRERWARVVDGPHRTLDIAWQFDEFLWLDAATRLLVAVKPDGSIVVGRSLNTGRCASLQRFTERTATECRVLLARGAPHRYQPFAFTFFSASGERQGTGVVAPEGLEDFVVFDMAVQGRKVALAGTAVRLGASGAPDYYFEGESTTPLLPFDAYLAVVEGPAATKLHERFINLGRAEHLTALKWIDEGLVAGGGAGWNRWHGGMSISRGADPFLVLDPMGSAEPLVRTFPVTPDDRHALVLSLDVQPESILSVGQSDAPMTHSGDADPGQLVHGGLALELR